MSRRPQTEEERKFARHVGERLEDAIDAQDLTRDEAAERLGIHRSMLYRYLVGSSIPGSKVLQRACEELGLAVDYRGVTVDADYYKGDRPVEKPRVVPIQMQLFSRESFDGEFAHVDIRKKKHAAEETLELWVTQKLRGTAPSG
jgi:transcriptional regulator with XRE-family HTH domain